MDRVEAAQVLAVESGRPVQHGVDGPQVQPVQQLLGLVDHGVGRADPVQRPV